MPLPTQFAAATTATGAQLDGCLNALGAMSVIPCTITGTNALTVAVTASAAPLSAYQQNMTFCGTIASANTGAVTANAAGLGSLSVYKDSNTGPVPLVSGDLQPGNSLLLTYDAALNSNAGGFHAVSLGIVTSGGGGGGVSSFNSRTGAVVLTTADINTVMTSTSSVSITPTGSGTVKINPAAVGTIDNAGIGRTTPKDITMSGGAITAPLVGNSPSTSSTSALATQTTQFESTPEFLQVTNLISNRGQTHHGVDNLGDKVGLYIGAEGQAGSGDLWCINTVLLCDAGSGTYGATMWEPDLVNLNPNVSMSCINTAVRVQSNLVNTGASIATWLALLAHPGTGGSVLPSTGCVGTGISFGTGAFSPISAAGFAIWDAGTTGSGFLKVSGSHQSALTAAGGTLTNGLVFSGVSFGTAGITFINSSATYGIDFNSTTMVNAAIRVGNNQSIRFRNASNSVDILGMLVDGSNNMIIGDSNVGVIVVGTQNGGSISPNAVQDNLVDCGVLGAAWRFCTAHNFLTASDPSIKEQINPLPDVWEIVRGLSLISFVRAADETKTPEWGFDARNIRATYEKAGYKSKAWVVGADDIHAINLVPIVATLAKHNQEMAARIESLEQRLAALEAKLA